MYEFKFRIHFFAWLILALLLVFLLCHFVPLASAAENETLLYNGIELPNIEKLWDDKNKYPFAYIVLKPGGSYYLYFGSLPPYQFSDVDNPSRDMVVSNLKEVSYSFRLYVLSSSGDSWSYVNSGSSYSTTGTSGIAVWSSSDCYSAYLDSSNKYVDSGSLFLAGTDPQPVVPPPTSADLPVFTVQPPLITWVEYNVGDTPSAVTVEAVVDDGGTISYTWYRTIYAESGSPSNVVFSTGSTLVPDTSVVSDSSYYCVATNTNGEFSQSAYSRAYRVKVVESGAPDPPSETPTYPSADDIGSSVGDAFQGVLDQNDINTSEQGNSFVDQITQIVPNESQGFVNAMGGLVDSLSYGGTECVLTVPALVMPQIGDLVPQYTLLEKQEVDLESYFNMFPDFIVTLVQSLFTVALIVFCFKELYSTVSYFFVLRGGET